jgi:hypothetical protein
VMRVPERKLLGAMRRTEGVVDIEYLQLARLQRPSYAVVFVERRRIFF